MWYIVSKIKSDALSKQEMGAKLTIWLEQHANHKLKDAYAKNLNGIISNLGSKSKFVQFIEVVAEDASTSIYAQISETGGSIDLSEVVKHMDAPTDAVNALFSWAAHSRKKVTLTAADGALVTIYKNYGFVGNGVALPEGDKLKQKNINVPMIMDEEVQNGFINKYREGIFWEMLPDLIGGE